MILHFFYLLRFDSASMVSLKDIKRFNINDLERDDPLFIYIYYERANYTCPYCKIITKEVEKLSNIEIRKLNFYEDPLNGARFVVIFFPAIIIYDHKRSHYIELNNHEILQALINNRDWEHKDCGKIYNNPRGYLITFYAVTNYLFYIFLKKTHRLFDAIPQWTISIIIGLMFSIVIIIFIQIVVELFSKKEKTE